MRSEIGIVMPASPERVLALAGDVARWPSLLPHYRSVTVQATGDDRVLAQMVAVRRFGPLPVPVTWRAEQWSETADPDDLRLRFRHVRGVTRGMDVTWHIRPSPDGSRVSIEHRFERPLPLFGPRFLPALVDRLFTRPIASLTLRTFRDLVRRGTAATTHPGPAP